MQFLNRDGLNQTYTLSRVTLGSAARMKVDGGYPYTFGSLKELSLTYQNAAQN